MYPDISSETKKEASQIMHPEALCLCGTVWQQHHLSFPRPLNHRQQTNINSQTTTVITTILFFTLFKHLTSLVFHHTTFANFHRIGSCKKNKIPLFRRFEFTHESITLKSSCYHDNRTGCHGNNNAVSCFKQRVISLESEMPTQTDDCLIYISFYKRNLITIHALWKKRENKNKLQLQGMFPYTTQLSKDPVYYKCTLMSR